MPVTTAQDDRGFVRITFDGPWPATADMVRLQRASSGMSEVRRVLIDVTRATGPLPKFTNIREIIGSLDTSSPAVQARKRAVVVSSDLQFGVARSFQAMLPGQVEVFRDEADALAWLLAP